MIFIPQSSFKLIHHFLESTHIHCWYYFSVMIEFNHSFGNLNELTGSNGHVHCLISCRYLGNSWFELPFFEECNRFFPKVWIHSRLPVLHFHLSHFNSFTQIFWKWNYCSKRKLNLRNFQDCSLFLDHRY